MSDVTQSGSSPISQDNQTNTNQSVNDFVLDFGDEEIGESNENSIEVNNNLENDEEENKGGDVQFDVNDIFGNEQNEDDVDGNNNHDDIFDGENINNSDKQSNNDLEMPYYDENKESEENVIAESEDNNDSSFFKADDSEDNTNEDNTNEDNVKDNVDKENVYDDFNILGNDNFDKENNRDISTKDSLLNDEYTDTNEYFNDEENLDDKDLVNGNQNLDENQESSDENAESSDENAESSDENAESSEDKQDYFDNVLEKNDDSIEKSRETNDNIESQISSNSDNDAVFEEAQNDKNFIDESITQQDNKDTIIDENDNEIGDNIEFSFDFDNTTDTSDNIESEDENNEREKDDIDEFDGSVEDTDKLDGNDRDSSDNKNEVNDELFSDSDLFGKDLSEEHKNEIGDLGENRGLSKFEDDNESDTSDVNAFTDETENIIKEKHDESLDLGIFKQESEENTPTDNVNTGNGTESLDFLMDIESTEKDENLPENSSFEQNKTTNSSMENFDNTMGEFYTKIYEDESDKNKLSETGMIEKEDGVNTFQSENTFESEIPPEPTVEIPTYDLSEPNNIEGEKIQEDNNTERENSNTEMSTVPEQQIEAVNTSANKIEASTQKNDTIETHKDEESTGGQQIQSTLSLDQILDSELNNRLESLEYTGGSNTSKKGSLNGRALTGIFAGVGLCLLAGIVVVLAFPFGGSDRKPGSTVDTGYNEPIIEDHSVATTGEDFNTEPSGPASIVLEEDPDDENPEDYDNPQADEEVVQTTEQPQNKEEYTSCTGSQCIGEESGDIPEIEELTVSDIMPTISEFKNRAESYYSKGDRDQDKKLIKYAAKAIHLCEVYQEQIENGEGLDSESFSSFESEFHDLERKMNIYLNGDEEDDNTVITDNYDKDSEAKKEVRDYLMNRD